MVLVAHGTIAALAASAPHGTLEARALGIRDARAQRPLLRYRRRHGILARERFGAGFGQRRFGGQVFGSTFKWAGGLAEGLGAGLLFRLVRVFLGVFGTLFLQGFV